MLADVSCINLIYKKICWRGQIWPYKKCMLVILILYIKKKYVGYDKFSLLKMYWTDF